MSDISGFRDSGAYNHNGVMTPTAGVVFLGDNPVPELSHGILSSEDLSVESPVDSFDPLPRMIRESSLFIQAYDLLSSDKSYGGPFLQQLMMVPDSHAIRDPNLWDNIVNSFGGTSGYDNAITDAFNTAMDEIRVIVLNYQTFKNGLPSEQVSQLAEAGINAAITGEGVTSSAMPESLATALSQPNASQTAYSNEQLSQGVSSFVDFLSAMSSLVGTGFNAASLMGMLDIAERDSYNKQQTHDLLMSQMGVLTDSPYRVLFPTDTPVLATNAESAAAKSYVDSAQSVADKNAVDSEISFATGRGDDGFIKYEVKSGMDWMVEASRYQIANRFALSLIDQLRNAQDVGFAGILRGLENGYLEANYSALQAESFFNADYYTARDGMSEGFSQTTLAESLATIREYEANIKSVESWLADYRSAIIGHWGEQLEQRPSLAPYFYKAMFDFGMEDTFFHQSPAAMGLKYGLQSLDSIGSFLGHMSGFKKPKLSPKRTGSTTVTKGPKGQMTTETTIHYDE